MTRTGVARATVMATAMAAALCVAPGASAQAWSTTSATEPAGTTDGQLTHVSCPSSSFCMAVGTAVEGSDQVDIAAQWNGSTWTSSVIPVSVDPPVAVSCPSSRFCMVAGSGSSSAWSGGSWTYYPAQLPASSTPYGFTENALTSVSCLSASLCTAVGTAITYGPPPALFDSFVESWNATAWSMQQNGAAQGTASGNAGFDGSELFGVSCVPGSSCLAVGDELTNDESATHGDDPNPYTYATGEPMAESPLGSTWLPSAASGPNPQQYLDQLLAVSCTTSSACTAVGRSTAPASGTSTSLVDRFNGIGWTTENTGNDTTDQLQHVSCPTTSDCTAVGYSAGSDGLDGAPIAEQWNGLAWSYETIPGLTSDSDLSCAGATTCAVVGDGLTIATSQ
jgi:hypothetical protein